MRPAENFRALEVARALGVTVAVNVIADPDWDEARFAAIRSFMKYAASRDPVSLPIAQRVLAIPMKRFARPMLHALSREEMAAVLEAPDSSTWSGQRALRPLAR